METDEETKWPKFGIEVRQNEEVAGVESKLSGGSQEVHAAIALFVISESLYSVMLEI